MLSRVKKYFNYEFWPFWVFYAPFIPLWVYYSTRLGAFTYFCNCNPGIEWGGFFDYSKQKVLDQIPQKFLPTSQIIYKKEDLTDLRQFPFILKPDKGERGKGVALIKSNVELQEYLLHYNWKSPLIKQSYLTEAHEFAIFFVRIPGEQYGQILSITKKAFLTVQGNGKQTLYELLQENPRVMSRIHTFEKKFKKQWHTILPKGKQLLVEPIGNHNRGTTFLDGSYLNSQELSRVVNAISVDIEGFYYGRFDVKAHSVEDLKKGIFKVMEVNGANSEPTHIYDPKHSIKYAYKEVYRHLKWQYKIALQNNKNGHKWHSHRGLFVLIFNFLLGKKPI